MINSGKSHFAAAIVVETMAVVETDRQIHHGYIFEETGESEPLLNQKPDTLALNFYYTNLYI